MKIEKILSSQCQEFLTSLLKVISIVVVILFIGNVFFNVFYFNEIGRNWLSVLELADYYEGNILSIWRGLSFFIVAGCVYFLSIAVRKDYLWLKEREKLPILTTINMVAKIICMGVLILGALILSYRFGMIWFVLLILMFLYTQFRAKYFLFFSLIVIYWGIMAFLGIQGSLLDYNNPQNFIQVDKGDFPVIRCVKQGCIVREKQRIVFYKWENISNVWYEINCGLQNRYEK